MSTLRMFVELEPSESEAGADSGGKGDDSGNLISLWNLYRYVHHNPELEALAKSHRWEPQEKEMFWMHAFMCGG